VNTGRVHKDSKHKKTKTSYFIYVGSSKAFIFLLEEAEQYFFYSDKIFLDGPFVEINMVMGIHVKQRTFHQLPDIK
jgi:hypothetical protein